MYLQHQSNKQSNIKTDPLVDILTKISINPTAYTNIQTSNPNNSKGQYHEQISSINQIQEAKDKKNLTKGQTTVAGKEIHVFQEKIKQCFKAVKS